MPRTARIISKETPMHIICRGNNKLPVLANNSDKQRFYCLLYRFKIDNQIAILHYCIMHNHVHLIVWLDQAGNLSRFMKQLSLAYYHYYIKKYDYCGHLWQGRFKSVIIKSDSQALQCGRYIEINPIRAGIISEPGRYLFSSYRYYAQGEEDILVTPNPAYEGLGVSISAKRIAYTSFITDQQHCTL